MPQPLRRWTSLGAVRQRCVAPQHYASRQVLPWHPWAESAVTP